MSAPNQYERSMTGSFPAPQYGPPQQPTPKPKSSRAAIIAAVAGVVVGAGVVLGIMLPLYSDSKDSADYWKTVANEQSDATVTVTETETKTVTATPPPPTTTAAPTTEAPAGPQTTFGPGTWKVGTDIAPGTYKATGELCYWARLSGFSGQLEDIIANGNGTGGQIVVTIAESDVAFTSERCGQWTPA